MYLIKIKNKIAIIIIATIIGENKGDSLRVYEPARGDRAWN